MESIVDLKIYLPYFAMFIPLIIFTVATGILFFRHRAVSTGLFFGGAVVGTIAHILQTVGVVYLSRTSGMVELKDFTIMLSAVSFCALLVEAIGLIIFALELPEKTAETQPIE